MNELFLYDRDQGLFKKILAKSKVIQGRYFVSTNSGADLNTGNIESYINDALKGITDASSKYPCCMCLPPNSNIFDLAENQNGESFDFKLFFLCTTGYTRQSQVKQPNTSTNTSTHHIWYDWKDMKEVALNFFQALKKVIKTNRLQMYVNFRTDSILVKRLTKFNNDSVSGVLVAFSIDITSGECELKDYDENDLFGIDITPDEIHALHKH